jgi:hypothetical protein
VELKAQSKINIDSLHYKRIPPRPATTGEDSNYLVFSSDRSATVDNPYFAQTPPVKGKNGIMIFIRDGHVRFVAIRIGRCSYLEQPDQLDAQTGIMRRKHNIMVLSYLRNCLKRRSEKMKSIAPIPSSVRSCGQMTSRPAPRNRTASASMM